MQGLVKHNMNHISISKNWPGTWLYQLKKFTKSLRFLRQSSKKYLRLRYFIMKNHLSSPPSPHCNVEHPCNRVYRMWRLSGKPKQHFPTLLSGKGGVLRYFLDDCRKSLKVEKKFQPNFFALVIFSLFWPFWPKNDEVPRKKNFTR